MYEEIHIRKAFDSPYLPVEVLWRQKNSFLMEWDTIGLIN
jgi:hypothetical protein